MCWASQLYTYEADVVAVDPTGQEPIRIVMLRPHSARPVLSASVDMPASLPDEDGA